MYLTRFVSKSLTTLTYNFKGEEMKSFGVVVRTLDKASVGQKVNSATG